MNLGAKLTIVIKDFEHYKEQYNSIPIAERDSRDLPEKTLERKVVGKDKDDIKLICSYYAFKIGAIEYSVSPAIATTEKPGVTAYEPN